VPFFRFLVEEPRVRKSELRAGAFRQQAHGEQPFQPLVAAVSYVSSTFRLRSSLINRP
jgi:hypothetical protein